MKTNSSILKVVSRKLALALLMGSTAIAAFAISGDGRTKNTGGSKRSLLSGKTTYTSGSFSLRSGYNFRGNQVISKEEKKYITLKSNITYQTGHTSYIVPLKKKVVLGDKITFNPNAATRR